jgi:hypothetical protein
VPEEILKHDVFGDDGDIRLQFTHPETFWSLCGEEKMPRSVDRLGDAPDPLAGTGSLWHDS